MVMVMDREQVYQAAGGDLRHGPHLPDRHLQRDGAAHLRPWVPRHLLEERFRCDGTERESYDSRWHLGCILLKTVAMIVWV